MLDDDLRQLADSLHTPQPVNDTLAEAIREAGLGEDFALRAAKGEFSDFDGPYATPKFVLVGELLIAGAYDLAGRVKAGEFDG